MKTRIRLGLTLVALCSLATALGASQSIAAEAAPQSAAASQPSDASGTAAAKRCKRGYKRVHGKCTPTRAHSMRLFKKALTFSRLDRAYSSSNYSSSGTERYDFCRGYFSYYSEHFTDYSFGSTSAQGRWRVLDARFNAKLTRAQGRVQYYDTDNDFPSTEQITLLGPNQTFVEGVEYTRTSNTAEC